MFISVLLIVIPIRMVNLTVMRGEVCNYSAFIRVLVLITKKFCTLYLLVCDEYEYYGTILLLCKD